MPRKKAAEADAIIEVDLSPAVVKAVMGGEPEAEALEGEMQAIPVAEPEPEPYIMVRASIRPETWRDVQARVLAAMERETGRDVERFKAAVLAAVEGDS